LFADSKHLLFPGNPLHHLHAYREFTDSSLLVDVSRWPNSQDPEKRSLGERWRELLQRRIRWKMVCQRTQVYSEHAPERSSIFSDPGFVEQKLRERLDPELGGLPLRVDIPRHIYRPHTKGPIAGQNFLYDSAHDRVRPLSANALVYRLPVSQRTCRIYAESTEHAKAFATALDALISGGEDDLTNV
jgi:hypothetical protein